ncbi:unnamed protein product [Spirodela intermedia]|uniref:Uncharacterized protein n=2 Tax=Spirodela intermedia TaxID=51605 RepID=A0A7I8KR96_SPIIN|nr:unnamed protein product [Spirodela intermedia]CAA6663163.1 unnamed protein product [Spirodela intermedia]CAA7399608.1 unnamed protein product [Spirodela intermedia]
MIRLSSIYWVGNAEINERSLVEWQAKST